MSKDKHGKDCKVGDVVQHADGSKTHVVGVIKTPIRFVQAQDVEVYDAFVGGKGAGADGDSIIWGS